MPAPKQYILNPPLLEAELLADPLAQFEQWLTGAKAAGMMEPTAMTLASVDASAKPSARIVLFKGVFEDGLTFYTNYEGRKGRELADNPNVALVFWWDQLERQVRIEGVAERLPEAMSEGYFHARPRGSQLGALTSRQSRIVQTREDLEQRLADAERRYEGQTVPHPDYWGGYVVRPRMYEFWQGRLNRLHDRLCYRRDRAGWIVERLEP